MSRVNALPLNLFKKKSPIVIDSDTSQSSSDVDLKIPQSTPTPMEVDSPLLDIPLYCFGFTKNRYIPRQPLWPCARYIPPSIVKKYSLLQEAFEESPVKAPGVILIYANEDKPWKGQEDDMSFFLVLNEINVNTAIEDAKRKLEGDDLYLKFQHALALTEQIYKKEPITISPYVNIQTPPPVETTESKKYKIAKKNKTINVDAPLTNNEPLGVKIGDFAYFTHPISAYDEKSTNPPNFITQTLWDNTKRKLLNGEWLDDNCIVNFLFRLYELQFDIKTWSESGNAFRIPMFPFLEADAGVIMAVPDSMPSKWNLGDHIDVPEIARAITIMDTADPANGHYGDHWYAIELRPDKLNVAYVMDSLQPYAAGEEIALRANTFAKHLKNYQETWLKTPKGIEWAKDTANRLTMFEPKDEYTLEEWKVPRQKDGSSCGVFACMNIFFRMFFGNPKSEFDYKHTSEDIKAYRQFIWHVITTPPTLDADDKRKPMLPKFNKENPKFISCIWREGYIIEEGDTLRIDIDKIRAYKLPTEVSVV